MIPTKNIKILAATHRAHRVCVGVVHLAATHRHTHTHTPHKADILATYVLKSPGLGQAERVTYVLRARTRYLSVTQPVSQSTMISLSSHTAIRIPAHSKSH